jgi:rhomboid protease GluP
VTTTTFGKRGLTPPPAPKFTTAAAPAQSAPAALNFSGQAKRATRLADRLPILTIGLIVFLLGIFEIERRLAFDAGKGGQISLESLIAFGGASYDRVIGEREYWRLFLAPLLHGNDSHVIGNGFALLFVGLRLESLIGRAWLAAIFVASALGGEAGSLLGNAHATTTVGASGAISGLIGALFVVSFQVTDPLQQRKMMRTALRFGVPALAPLLFGASGHVDYYAHSAGAVTGALAGGLMSAFWREDAERPDFTRQAAAGAALALALSLVACGFAARQYASHSERAAQFIPAAEIPDGFKVNGGKAGELLARYPNDPRAHLSQTVVYLRTRELASAEADLRKALALASTDFTGQPVVGLT